jgi:hypothetical protein
VSCSASASLKERPTLAHDTRIEPTRNVVVDVPRVQQMLVERHGGSVFQLAALPETPLREPVATPKRILVVTPVRIDDEWQDLEEKQIDRLPRVLVAPKLG